MTVGNTVTRDAPPFKLPPDFPQTDRWIPTIDPHSYELRYDDMGPIVDQLTEALVKLEDKTGTFKYKIADGRIIDSVSWNFWEWPQAIGLNGLFTLYQLLPTNSAERPRVLNIITSWYNARHHEGGTTKNVNTMAVMYTLACLLELEAETGGVFTFEEKDRYHGWIDEWAEWVMNELPRTDQGGFQHITLRDNNTNQLWDDTLMMTVIPLTKIGLLLNRPHYIEEAHYQFAIHTQYLMDTSTGLWYHGWEFDGKGGGHNFAKSLWGRGNCWVTISIPLFLSLLPNLSKTDPMYRSLTAAFRRQVGALLPTQDRKTGLWRTLIDDPSTYVETSATSGFVAGMLMGIRLGILDKEKYLPSALLGLKGCIAQIQPNGEVANCSKGTPVGRDNEFYKHIPRIAVPYGQSLLIVACTEWMRMVKSS